MRTIKLCLMGLMLAAMPAVAVVHLQVDTDGLGLGVISSQQVEARSDPAKISKTRYTDSDGTCTFSNLTAGFTYQLRVTLPPDARNAGAAHYTNFSVTLAAGTSGLTNAASILFPASQSSSAVTTNDDRVITHTNAANTFGGNGNSLANVGTVTNISFTWTNSATHGYTNAPSGSVPIVPGWYWLNIYLRCTEFVANAESGGSVKANGYWNNGLLNVSTASLQGNFLYPTALGYELSSEGYWLAPALVRMATNAFYWSTSFYVPNDLDACGDGVITLKYDRPL